MHVLEAVFVDGGGVAFDDAVLGKEDFFLQKEAKTLGWAVADSGIMSATAEEEFFGPFLQKRTAGLMLP
jgi:hypothetical protein